jgi:hypothetical protein
MLLAFLFAAACAAMGLNHLAKDIGVPRREVVLSSFGSAAFLALVCVIATIRHHRTK